MSRVCYWDNIPLPDLEYAFRGSTARESQEWEGRRVSGEAGVAAAVVGLAGWMRGSRELPR